MASWRAVAAGLRSTRIDREERFYVKRKVTTGHYQLTDQDDVESRPR